MTHRKGLVMSRLTELRGRMNGRLPSLPFNGNAPRWFDESTNLVAALASHVLGDDESAATRLTDELQACGISAESICLDIIDPAARRLGEHWARDDCTDLEMTLGLCRLQTLVRRLGPQFARPVAPLARKGRSVLLATSPGEPHMLAIALASEFYLQAGWEAACEFPNDIRDLTQFVRRHRVDVLHLSLSSVFRRDHRLTAMAEAVRLARAASRNPNLVVVVSGRVFVDSPEWTVLVGADASSVRIDRAAALAESLVQSATSRAYVKAHQAIASVGEMLAQNRRSVSR